MTVKLDVFYPHRHNRDGTVDSICLSCLATVATSKSEAVLVGFEKAHVCDAGSLADRRCYIPHSRWSGDKTSVPVSSLGTLLG
jgi:hypothetical protein